MTKLVRVTNKVFASSAASNEIGQFGSVIAGSKLETADVATIQALTAWLTGCSEALVSGNRYISLQEFNGFGKVITYQQAYQAQEGIAEYDSATTYYIGSIVKKTGTFELYGSLTDDNTGNALSSASNWKLLIDLNDIAFADEDLSNITSTAKNTILSMIAPDLSSGVSKTWNTSYTATQAGWVSATATIFSGGVQSAYLTINSISFVIVSAASGGDAHSATGNIFRYIDIGDTYIGTSGSSAQSLTFYPAKGAS